MQKHFHKALAAMLTFMAVIGFYIAPAQAALMGGAQVQLSNPRPASDSRYIFTAKLGSTHIAQAIKMTWLTAATGGATPTGLSSNNPTITAVSANLGTSTSWTPDFTHIAEGYITMINNAQGEITKDTEISWTLSGITNPTITQRGAGSPGCTSTDNAGTGNGNLSTGTCFIKIQTYDNTGMLDANKKDDVTITFAVTADVVMQAKVDPALTFVVAGVAAGAAAGTANTQSTTTNLSTYNGLDFLTLTPNAIRLLAHDLTVRTNANSGFIVYGRMTTALTGTSVNTNNIDPFTGNGATATAPAAWTSPTVDTKNVNTGYLGYNTSQWSGIDGISNFGATLWAPLSSDDPTSTNQPHVMMDDNDQNDGATATRVSYALEVDVYQPSDSYAGVLQYNVVPKY